MAIDFTARGSGYYRVFVDGSQVSQHTTEREALERATELELHDPGRDVYIDHDYHVLVVAEGSPAPDPDPDDPAPDPNEPDPEPDPAEPDPDDPVDPDPDDPVDPEPEPDPLPDPDDPVDPDPPVDPPAPPPPADPSGAFLRVDWNYAQLHNGSDRHPTTYGPDNGHSRQVILAQPGPWGGTNALRNTFFPKPRTTQPQVGTRIDFGRYTERVYLETWLRFSPNWTVQPTFRWPDDPNTPEDESQQETGNTDHKTLFLFSMTPGTSPWQDWHRRWDFKCGPNGSDIIGSGGKHGTQEEAYYEAGHIPAIGRRDGQPKPPGVVKCDAHQMVWDNQWHQLRWFCQVVPVPTIQVWLDGILIVDSTQASPTPMRAEPTHRFWSCWFGGNRNSGPTEEMWFEVGPATFLASDPGW